VLIKPSILDSVWKVKPTSILHIGAHMAEESDQYQSLQWGSVVWIEAQKELAERLSEKFKGTNQRVIHTAIWDTDNLELNLNITNNSQSTSLLELGTHREDYPDVKVSKIEIVKTSRIDSLFDKETIPEFINIDIQGAEIQALKGFGELLHSVKYVYSEVNKKEVYVDCANVSEVDEYLKLFGFKRIITRWVPLKGWGDAFYMKSSLISASKFAQIIGIIYGSTYPVIYFTKFSGSKLKNIYSRFRNSDRRRTSVALIRNNPRR
jgi:FkbM family methyltransferase